VSRLLQARSEAAAHSSRCTARRQPLLEKEVPAAPAAVPSPAVRLSELP
jgi:hypothetical protein